MLSRPDPTFEQGIESALPMLRAFAVSLCRDTVRADDLVQETVLRALINRHTFQIGTNLEAWLSTILRNSFYSGRRKLREAEDPDDALARLMLIEASPLQKMEAVEMLRLVEKLPEQYRRPLLLLADGATYEEVAEEMHEHIGTIKSRVNRGRALLGGKVSSS